ncbi:MAG: Smr/MutS family protein [Deltaproteobacteria bacterium]|nr:Smr/MutS family protein [Deltaproteobacteria bacterium]
MKKEKDPFNPAFRDLPRRVKKGRETLPCPREEPDPPPVETPDDGEFFLEAMSDVDPLPGSRIKRHRRSGANLRPSHPAPDDVQEVMTHLYGLVKGAVDMDITFSDEYMEGAVKGFSRKLMKRLKRGEFPVQDYIDLHGLTREEARKEVGDFLIRSHRIGLRCVLIVHGRGLNSPASFPVLKEGLPLWLGQGPVRKIVLAFATARPYDGGTGAVYVLLKKR